MREIVARCWPVCCGLLVFGAWWHSDSMDRDGPPPGTKGVDPRYFHHPVKGFPFAHSRDHANYRLGGFSSLALRVTSDLKTGKIEFPDRFEVFDHLAYVINIVLGLTISVATVCFLRAAQWMMDPSAETKKRLRFWVNINVVVIVVGFLWILIERAGGINSLCSIDYYF